MEVLTPSMNAARSRLSSSVLPCVHVLQCSILLVLFLMVTVHGWQQQPTKQYQERREFVKGVVTTSAVAIVGTTENAVAVESKAALKYQPYRVVPDATKTLNPSLSKVSVRLNICTLLFCVLIGFCCRKIH